MREKKTMMLFYDWLELFEELDDAEVGNLIRAIIKYDLTGEEPNYEDRSMRVVFKAMKNATDLSNDKYDAVGNARREAASKRWKKDESKECKSTICNANDANAFFAEACNAKDALIDYTKLEVNKLDSDSKPKAKRFTAPTVDQIKEYCAERGNGLDAQRFVDYYERQGWKLANGRPMVDWKAAVRTWEQRDKKAESPKATKFTDFQQRDYDYAELERKLFGG